jgi:23S rRNA pseudouridine2605 synthase
LSHCCPSISSFSTYTKTSSTIRLSKLLSHGASMSRREAERLIAEGQVTVAGKIVDSPAMLLEWKDIKNNPNVIKIKGKPIDLSADGNNPILEQPKVWAVHKLAGEIVSHNDPHGRPSLLERLIRGGVGKEKDRVHHLKPIGRLDMSTEGLILITTSGDYARQMELPMSNIHRTYRARVHGVVTPYKLDRIRRGGIQCSVNEGVRYGAMQVNVERPPRGRSLRTSTNTWLRITSTEGKNRQIRNVMESLGLTVNRLIRVSYGDYDLNTIPQGLAVPVPYKPIDNQRNKGALFPKKTRKEETKKVEESASQVQWVRSV